LVEHDLAKVGVASSSLVSRSKPLSAPIEAAPIKLADAKKAGKGACDICKPNELGKAKLNQCSGKTADGTRCKRMTANKTKKCFQHEGK
jgi:hypothetical protein